MLKVGRATDDAAVGDTSRSRNYYSIGIRTVIVLALVIAFVVVYTRVGERHEVLAVAREVPAGQVIQASDLREARLSSDPGVRPVAARDARLVVEKKVAKVTLVPGTTLAWDALSPSTAALGPNEAVVGISLKPGAYPDEPRAGDDVKVVQGGSTTGLRAEEATTIVESARVRSLTRREKESEGGVLVSLVVPADRSAAVAAGAAAGRIALAVIGSV